jgi:hypothetical protein
MKSVERARIVVVADEVRGFRLAARLRRMDLSRVATVARLEEARCICRTGCADACLVVRNNAEIENFPLMETEEDAPGNTSGVPSLMLADVVTPHLRKAARRAGYLATVPAGIPARLLYRRIGGALQNARGRAARDRKRLVHPALLISIGILKPPAEFGKPTFH